jgi:hypothetical protein
LSDVWHGINVPHHATNQTFDATLVFDDQQVKRLVIARQRSLYQQTVAVGRRSNG